MIDGYGLAVEIKYGKRAVIALMVINTVVFALGMFFSFLPIAENPAYLLGGSNILHLLQGRLNVLVTANFLHVDILHFIFNMVALYSLGGFVESFFGGRKMFGVFLWAGVIGMLFSTIAYQSSFSLGASAGIYGFVGLLIGNKIRSNTYSPDLPIDTEGIINQALLWLFVSLAMPAVSFWGHVGGLIGGVIFGLLFESENSFSPTRFDEIAERSVFWSGIFAVLLAYGFLVIDLFV